MKYIVWQKSTKLYFFVAYFPQKSPPIILIPCILYADKTWVIRGVANRSYLYLISSVITTISTKTIRFSVVISKFSLLDIRYTKFLILNAYSNNSLFVIDTPWYTTHKRNLFYCSLEDYCIFDFLFLLRFSPSFTTSLISCLRIFHMWWISVKIALFFIYFSTSMSYQLSKIMIWK